VGDTWDVASFLYYDLFDVVQTWDRFDLDGLLALNLSMIWTYDTLDYPSFDLLLEKTETDEYFETGKQPNKKTLKCSHNGGNALILKGA
jgi:hypothetical protein